MNRCLQDKLDISPQSIIQIHVIIKLFCFVYSINKNLFLSLSGYSGKISQMPVILTPLHFDRDPLQKQPSCRRSVVVRTFITSDFMTGIPAMPGNHIPEEVRHDSASQLCLSRWLDFVTLSYRCVQERLCFKSFFVLFVSSGGSEDGE